MTTKTTDILINNSLEDFECGKYSQCLKTLEEIQFQTFDLLEWVRDNNIAICSLVSKQYTQTVSAVKDFAYSTQVKLENLLTKIRSFNSAENNLALMTECVVLYNLILLNSKYQSEENSTQKFVGENLNSHLEITVKRILGTHIYPSTWLSDNETEHKFSKIGINESLLCCLKPLLHLWSCVVSTDEKQHLEALVKTLHAENSNEITEWDIRFALPASLGLTNQNPVCVTISDNMTAIFQVFDIALRTGTFNCDTAKQINHVAWIPYIRYVEAYCLYKKGEYQKALDVLDRPEQNFTGDLLQSFVLNMEGCCLFKLGNYWSGIQKFQSSLKKNFSFHFPLYNVTLVYRHQQKVDAELDSLKYLVKALEIKGNEPKEHVVFQLNRFIISKTPSYSLPLLYALYLQSHRSLQLGYFSQASEHFLDLLTFLMETPVIQPSDPFNNSTPIPGILEIHLEAAFCMLSAERYSECIIVCNWLLLSCISDFSSVSFSESFEEPTIFDNDSHSDQEEDFLFSNSEISKKRSYSKISSRNYFPNQTKYCISEQSSVNDILVSALLYKADAYFHLQDTENVFSCLQSATNMIKNEDANLIPASPELQPLPKRQKVSLTNQSTSDPSYPMELKYKRDYQNTLISSVYNNTGVLLQCKGQFQEALHCFRLGLQIKAGDSSLNFNCALTLIKLKKTKEMAFFWAKHRGFDLSMSQLRKTLSEKQKELELLQNANQENLTYATKITDPPTSYTLLRFDICILCKLLQLQSK